MDVLSGDTEHLFLLPVALIFQNESGLEEQGESGYNATTSANVNVNQTGQGWKREEIVFTGLQRLEKVGDAIKRELKWAFILHTYGFGCLFFILAFYTFFSILNIRSFISSKPFMSTINGFLCLLGTSRAASLFIDPYNLKENMPKLFGQVLWDLGFPSIISAFCLVQLAFLQFTQLQVGPEGLRRKSCLSLIVTAHFLLTIGMDIVAASNENLMIVKHVVHYIFLTWGVFLCSNFLYSGYKVMSMIRNIPGGMKNRDLPDPSYKGIMQLAILSPHNNLAGSMTAALLPTLCAPKIHQKDNTSLSTVGFRSDGNSRILESESIPMLEEMTGSSGDEISPKPLARASSFQNQTRNSQKFNLKPKLSLRSVSNDAKDEEFVEVYYSGQRSPQSGTSKTLSVKGTEFDFNVKPTNGILKHAENLPATRSNHDLKSKTHKTCFENENFNFAGEKKSASVSSGIPEILVSGPGNSDNGKVAKGKGKKSEGNGSGSDKNQKTLNKLMNEISKDLDEMQILREEKAGKSEELAEVHESRRNKCESESENESKKKAGLHKCSDCRKETVGSRRGSQSCEKENRKNLCRKECNHSGRETAASSSETENLYSALTDITKFEKAQAGQQRARGVKKGKTLSWKKKTEDEEEKATQECLLLQENLTDVTLTSVLNHIAYMNRGTSINANSEEDLENVRKTKVEWVLNITYITAMWGLMLCLSNMGKIYSPFGVPAPRRVITTLNSTYLQDVAQTEPSERRIVFSSWPWLWFQTFCRALELAMGCAMANITRQPAADHRYPRTSAFRNRDTFYSI